MAKTIKHVLPLFLIAMLLLLALPVHAEDSTYPIDFKAGSHGTVNGGETYTQTVAYGGTLNMSDVSVVPERGYYFTGWTPDVETTVTGGATYVARYAKTIEEKVYRVNYVDTNGNALATQKIAVTNNGVTVTEYAVPIDGYAVDAVAKNATVGDVTELSFVYTSTAGTNVVDNIQTITIPGTTTVITVATPAGGTTTGTGTGTTTTGTAAAGTATAGTAGTTADGTTAGTTGTADNAGVTTDGTTQQGTTITEDQVPLADQNLSNKTTDSSQSNLRSWVIIGAAALIAALVIYLVVKKMRKAE